MNQKNQQFKTKTSLVLYFVKGSKHLFFLTVLFSCFAAFLDLVNPQIIGYTVDNVIGDNGASAPAWLLYVVDRVGGIEYLREHLYIIALCVIGIAILGAAARYFYRLINSMGAEKLVKRMRDLLSDHIMHLPFTWYGSVQTGDIIQRCTSDVETVKVFFSEQLTNFFRIVVLMIMSLTFMAKISVRLTLVSASFIPIIVLYSIFFHGKIGDAFMHADTEEGKLSAIVQENLTGVRVVRAFGRESYEKERFDTQNASYTKMWIRMMRILSAFWASNDLISGLQILCTVVFGAIIVVHGGMTAGQYISFIAYNAMLTWPVRMLGRVITEMSRAGISIGRIQEIMNAEIESDHPDAVDAPKRGDIVFDHVSFSYENGGEAMKKQNQGVLQDVTFTVKEGSTVGILGGTGSGKSTLMYLLDRIYELPADHGKITIGGVDIADMKSDSLRSKIGIVLQEPYLFSRTLAENIAITQDQLQMDDVRHAARTASLEDTISKFVKGYETFVGERGVTLSGGQKQRAAIAQTLMKDADVLIFDDSLSAVDARTDAHIRKALKSDTKDATVILIAHRITTLMQADQIIVLDEGRIAERGTHQELLAANGIYKKIYDLQTAGLEA